MRNYGRVAPALATPNKPSVSSVTGLGVGGGASYQSPDADGYGYADIFIGTGSSPNWSVALTYPSAPPVLFVAAGDEMGTITQGTVGNVVTITGTGASVLAGTRHRVHTEWFTSF